MIPRREINKIELTKSHDFFILEKIYVEREKERAGKEGQCGCADIDAQMCGCVEVER